MKRWVFFISLILLVFACSNDKSITGNTKPGTLKLEKITADTSQSYWLFLPGNYQNNGTFPVIFAFDAHGNGKKMAQWLMPYANRYGYVIASSNAFHNNVQGLSEILDNLLADVTRKYKLDPDRFYTAGFSGGGRVATYLTAVDSRFKGVASLSAGLQFSMINNRDFVAILFAGKRDFNYWEIVRLSPQVASKYGIPLQTVVFDGGHEYPPKEYSQFVFAWFDAFAMKKGYLAKDKALVQRLEDFADSLVDNAQDINSQVEANMFALKLLSDLANTRKYKNNLDQLEQSEAYKKYQEKINKISGIENYLQKQYVKALQTQSLDWWKREIEAIDNKIANEQDPDYKAMYYRIKAYISILCFSMSRDLIQNNFLDQASRIVKIYQLDDPENPDVYFYRSCLFAAKNQQDSALFYLKKSVDAGFNDWARIDDYKCFDKIKNSKQFLQIVKNH